MSEYELQNLIGTSDTTEGEPTTNKMEIENGKKVGIYTKISMHNLNPLKEESGSKYNNMKKVISALETFFTVKRVFWISLLSIIFETSLNLSIIIYAKKSDRSIPNYDLDFSIISSVIWLIILAILYYKYPKNNVSENSSKIFVFLGWVAFTVTLIVTWVYIICLIVGLAISVPNHPHKEEA